MRYILFLMPLLFVSCARDSSSDFAKALREIQWPDTLLQEVDFRIQIYKSSFLCCGASWEIRPDSLFAIRYTRQKEQERYAVKLDKHQRQRISKYLIDIELDRLNESYVNDKAPDDLSEFSFTIRVNSNSKKLHIYEYLVPEIAALTRQIDAYLPEKFRIMY